MKIIYAWLIVLTFLTVTEGTGRVAAQEDLEEKIKTILEENKKNFTLSRQKNEWNEDILDDWGIPTIWETVSTNEVKWSQISKTVRDKSLLCDYVHLPEDVKVWWIMKIDSGLFKVNWIESY